MTPTKVTIEGEREERLKAFCDEILYRAGSLMTEGGAPSEMMLDRFITYSAAHACRLSGSPHTAKVFREVADMIDAGLFHSVTGETPAPRKGH